MVAVVQPFTGPLPQLVKESGVSFCEISKEIGDKLLRMEKEEGGIINGHLVLERVVIVPAIWRERAKFDVPPRQTDNADVYGAKLVAAGNGLPQGVNSVYEVTIIKYVRTLDA